MCDSVYICVCAFVTNPWWSSVAMTFNLPFIFNWHVLRLRLPLYCFCIIFLVTMIVLFCTRRSLSKRLIGVPFSSSSSFACFAETPKSSSWLRRTKSNRARNGNGSPNCATSTRRRTNRTKTSRVCVPSFCSSNRIHSRLRRRFKAHGQRYAFTRF